MAKRYNNEDFYVNPFAEFDTPRTTGNTINDEEGNGSSLESVVVEFSGRLSDAVKTKQIKQDKKNVAIFCAVLAGIFLVMTIFVILLGKDVLAEDYLEGLGVSCCFTVLFAVISGYNFFSPIKRADMEKGREFTLTFDTATGFMYYRAAGAEIARQIPLGCITKIKDHGEFFSVYYRIRMRNGRNGKTKGKGATERFICQKDLMNRGTEADFLALAKAKVKLGKKLDAEARRQVKVFAVIGIVFAVLAAALCIPMQLLGKFLINDYAMSVLPNYISTMFSGDEALAVLGVLGFLFVVVYNVIVILLGCLCYVFPFPMILVAVIMFFIQLAYNRRWWTWLLLILIVVSLAVSIALFASVLPG